MSNKTKKILVFGAHPDDAEFGCGGLIIKETQKGNHVTIIVCSLGEAGSNGTPSIRKKEAKDAAKLMGADIKFIDMGGDCHIEYSPKNTIKIAKIIREYKPQIVLAQSLSPNQHPDHKVLSEIVRASSRLVRYGGLRELKKTPTHNIDALYYYPSSPELGGDPEIIVDVSAQYQDWMKAMSLHRSQMKTKGYLNLVGSKARAFGASIGVLYAIPLWTNDPIQVDALSDLILSSRKY